MGFAFVTSAYSMPSFLSYVTSTLAYISCMKQCVFSAVTASLYSIFLIISTRRYDAHPHRTFLFQILKHAYMLECSFKKLWDSLKPCNVQLCNFTSTVCYFQMGLVSVFSEFNLVQMVVSAELAPHEINSSQHRIGSMLCGCHNFAILVWYITSTITFPVFAIATQNANQLIKW